jgi:hypothetical protein
MDLWRVLYKASIYKPRLISEHYSYTEPIWQKEVNIWYVLVASHRIYKTICKCLLNLLD